MNRIVPILLGVLFVVLYVEIGEIQPPNKK
jgi:hypothetical protein